LKNKEIEDEEVVYVIDISDDGFNRMFSKNFS